MHVIELSIENEWHMIKGLPCDTASIQCTMIKKSIQQISLNHFYNHTKWVSVELQIRKGWWRGGRGGGGVGGNSEKSRII